MVKRRTKSRNRTEFAQRVVVIFFLSMLSIGLMASAWDLRGMLVPRDLAVNVDRKLHPDEPERRAPWVDERALALTKSLRAVTEAWEPSGTESRRVIRLRLVSDVPLEEGTRLVQHTFREAGLDILDAVEVSVEPEPDRDENGRRRRRNPESLRRVEIAYGLDGTYHGTITVEALGELLEAPLPTVALVLDDLGHNSPQKIDAFLDFPVPITVSILPSQNQSAHSLEGAKRRGHEVLLHLPMEPLGYPRNDPGTGAVFVDQSPAQIRRLVRDHLSRLPGVTGVSNHMGSLATKDRSTMSAVLEVVEEEGLYFLDSRTTGSSIVPKLATEMRIPCLVNDLFLDNDTSPAAVKSRLNELVALAKRKGSAIGIFHPHAASLTTLTREIERHQESGVRFVTLSNIDRKRWIGAIPRAH